MLRSVFVHQNVVHCELISCFDGCKERRVFGKRHSVALGQLQCTRWQRAIPFGVENCNGAPATSEMEMLYTDAGLIRSTCISSRAWSFNVAQLLRLRGASRCNGHAWARTADAAFATPCFFPVDQPTACTQPPSFRCSLDRAKRCFYRIANSTFGKMEELRSKRSICERFVTWPESFCA